jgi:hypothetical protein
MRKVKGAKRKPVQRYCRPAVIQSTLPPQHGRTNRIRLRPPPSKIHNGDTVAAVDLNGITWFGVAMGEVELDRPWPAVRVMVEQRIMIFPARDVSLWPAPETLMARRAARRAHYAREN